MLKFLLGIILGIATLTGLVFLLRLLLTLQSRLDRYFTSHYPRYSRGFRWGIRIPTKVGEVLQFYFYAIMGRKHYMNYSSWPVKVALMISVFLFLGFITGRRFFNDYYALGLSSSEGLNPYLHGGTILWYFNLVNLAFLGLLVMVSIDSVRMMGWFAPLRIGLNLVIIGVCALTTLISFSVLVAISFLYLAYKVLMLFFRSGRRYSRESSPSMLAGYYRHFLEVKNQFDSPDIRNDRDTERHHSFNPRLEYYDAGIRKLRKDA